MSRTSLIGIAVKYFVMRGYKIRKNENNSDPKSRTKGFDLVLYKGSETRPVMIKDWNRTVGVNIVISLDKLSQGLSLSSPVLVAEKFSEHAKSYAVRRGIKLITKSEMRREIRRI